MLGYDVPEVRAAIDRVLDRGVVHTSTLYLIRDQVELAERIAKLSGIPDAKVFFCSSGTEANEMALLLATQARRSAQVLALRNSYHGPLVRGDGHHRHPRLVGVRAVPGPGLVRARRLPLPVAVPGPARRRVQRGLRGRPAGRDRVDHRRRRGLHDRRAGAGRRRVRRPARRHARRDEADPRRVRDPADLRRGADRLGPHRRALLGHRGARRDAGHHDLRQGRRERHGHRRRGRPGRADGHLPANSISTFGGNPLATAAAAATIDYVLEHDLQANALKVGNQLLRGLRDLGEDTDASATCAARG
jgi:hypothetical protein